MRSNKPKSPIALYAKHFLIFFSTSSFTQILNFLMLPVLSRLYSPSYFGEFTVFLSASMLIGLISCGRLDISLQTTPKHEAMTVRQLSIMICIATSVILLFILAIASGIYHKANIHLEFIIFTPLLVFLIGFSNTASYTLLLHEDYKRQSISIFLRATCINLFQVAFAFTTSINGLMVGFIIGYLCQSLYLHIQCKKVLKPHAISKRRYKAMFYKYLVFVKYDVVNQLLSNLAFNSISFFMMFLYDASIVGYFGIAYRLIAVPVSIISGSLAQVYLQKAAAKFRDNESFYSVFKANLLFSMIGSILIFTCIFFLANDLFSLYLGKDWQPASAIAIGLVPFFAIRFVYSTISPTPLVIKKPGILFVFNLSTALFTILGFAIAYQFKVTADEFVKIFSYIQFPLYLAFILMLYKVAKRYTPFANVPT